jgi:hypothetical protein
MLVSFVMFRQNRNKQMSKKVTFYLVKTERDKKIYYIADSNSLQTITVSLVKGVCQISKCFCLITLAHKSLQPRTGRKIKPNLHLYYFLIIYLQNKAQSHLECYSLLQKNLLLF